jgi:hypothetical protein
MSKSGSGAGSGTARPLADFVRDVGLAVAEGQAELDRNSLATQLDIDRAATEGRLPHVLEAPWYRFGEVDVDMKLTVDTELQTRRSRDGTTFYHPRLTVQPAASGETTRETRDLTSSVHFQIVPAPPNLPPERTGADGTGDGEA